MDYLDMISMALDTVDIQARTMLPTFLTLVKQGQSGLDKKQSAKISLALHIFSGWDFRFEKDSSAASVYSTWEFMIASYLHETKIEGVTARRNFAYTFLGENFLNNQAKMWEKSGVPVYEEYC
jgi:acyl-homoserine lactone acylase PvdQ